MRMEKNCEKNSVDINPTAEYFYSVKADFFLAGSGNDLKLPFSFNINNLPLKSSDLDLSLSKTEKDSNNIPGLSWEILNQITENISSLASSEKSPSLVIRTLCSDFENSANLLSDIPFGLEIMSNPCFLRNFSSPNFTFSSLINLTEGNAELDIVSTPHKISGILESRPYMLFSQRRIVLNNFFNTHLPFKHLKNLPDHDSGVFESGLSVADFTVSNNIFIDFNSHKLNKDKEYLNVSSGNGITSNVTGVDCKYGEKNMSGLLGAVKSTLKTLVSDCESITLPLVLSQKENSHSGHDTIIDDEPCYIKLSQNFDFMDSGILNLIEGDKYEEIRTKEKNGIKLKLK